MLEAGPADAKVLSVFDFDGTLTHHDSFVPFLKFAFGKAEFCRRMVKLAVPGLRFLLRLTSRDELKAQLIRTFMTGVEKAWVQQQAQAKQEFDGPLTVSGDSAGANIVTAVALRARAGHGSALRGLALLYPTVDPACSSVSMRTRSVTSRRIAR